MGKGKVRVEKDKGVNRTIDVLSVCHARKEEGALRDDCGMLFVTKIGALISSCHFYNHHHNYYDQGGEWCLG